MFLLPIMVIMYSNNLMYALIILELGNVILIMNMFMHSSMEMLMLLITIQVLDSLVLLMFSLTSIMTWETSNWSLVLYDNSFSFLRTTCIFNVLHRNYYEKEQKLYNL